MNEKPAYDALKKTEGDNAGFVIRVSVANTLAYLIATIVPMVVDPKLLHHVRYGARTYAIGWWVAPMGIVVLLTTIFVMNRSSKRSLVFWNSFPLLVAGTVTLPFFRPEFPHVYVFGMIIGCCALSMVATWIRYWPIEGDYASNRKIDRTARLERAKEEIGFWRGGMFAVLAVFLAAWIGWYKVSADYNLRIDPDLSEQSLIGVASMLNITFMGLWMLFGPLAEAAKKTQEALGLLLKIES
ncbi:MAG: hypothetical protein ACLPT4_00665 [Verrucomicrobiia bacterium]